MYFSFRVEEYNDSNKISHIFHHFRIGFVEAISPVRLVTLRPCTVTIIRYGYSPDTYVRIVPFKCVFCAYILIQYIKLK